LPEPLTEARSELLPQVLREWSRSDLRTHLSWESREAKRGRIKKQGKVREAALKFLKALQALDGEDRIQICGQMIHAEGPRLEEVSRSEWANRRTRLDEETSFLANLAAIDPKKIMVLAVASHGIMLRILYCGTPRTFLSGSAGWSQREK
jgi:hypothetical protein